jgi:Glycosyl transferase family 90
MPIVEYISPPRDIVWKGHLSICMSYGKIIRFLMECLDNDNDKFVLAIPSCDGLSSKAEEQNLTLDNFAVEYYKKTAKNQFVVCKLIFGTLCTRDYYANEVVLLPLDDNSFKNGVYNELAKEVTFIPWEEKKPIAFWRGSASGFPQPNIRVKTVLALLDNPNSDVKFIKETNLEEYPYKKMYSDKVNVQEFLKHKYILIIDGTVIASSLQWTFASGSVPILITHPGNNWWFKKFLIPMVHYVPIAYDLSDLESQIQWLVENDDKAHEIAENAMKFSKEYLSAEFQQTYLAEKINRGIHVGSFETYETS